VEGHGHFRVQLQQLQQELVRQLRSHDLQKGRRPPGLAHPERPTLAEVKAVGDNEILCPHARLGDVPPGEAERLPASGVELAVEGLQPLPAVEDVGLHPQPLEVTHDVSLHTLQPGPGGGEVVGGSAERDILGADNAVIAPGNLPFQHIHILAPDAVKFIVGHRDIDLVAAPATGAVIDKGELERQGAVEVVQERTPPAENGRLILGGRNSRVGAVFTTRNVSRNIRSLRDCRSARRAAASLA